MKNNKLSTLFSKYGIVFMLFALILVMVILLGPGFLSISNIIAILNSSSIYGIMALGVTFIIISGGIDLSAGSLVAVAAVLCGAVGQRADASNRIFAGIPELGLFAAFVAAVAFGALFGAINGAMVAKLKLFPFIATLGTYTIYRGLALVITDGKPVTQLVPGFSTVGNTLFGFLPTPTLIFILCTALCWLLLNNTKFGCNTYSIGGNASAARITGINIARTTIGIYAFAGLLYGIASFVYAGRVLSVNPGAALNYEMSAISASIIGGTSPSGGSGTIWGVVVGTLILGVIRQGLTLLGVDAYWQQIAEGVIIVAAVIMAALRRKDAKA